MSSIARRFLVAVGIASVSITLLISGLVMAIVHDDLGRRQRQHMQEYARERVVNLSERFRALSAVHRDAAADLQARVAAMTPQEAADVFARRFPARPDGTRRSRNDAFDGALEPGGEYVHGMGAFLSPRPSDAAQTAVLAAAFDVVLHVGEGVHAGYDNFYFATPDDKLVMFGPDRPDRLEYYRATAPAALDFSKEEMMRIVAPGADPTGRTRCTSLQRYLQDSDKSQRMATACMTPVYVKGRFAGAFGSSVQMADFLSNAVREGMAGSTTLLARGEGDLLAYPGRSPAAVPSAAAIDAVQHEFALPALMRAVKATGRDQGLIQSPDGRRLVAFGRIPGPDWYLLITYPMAALNAAALRSALWIAALGLLAAALQTALILGLAQRYIIQPMRLLAASCLPEATIDPRTRALEDRADEIGVLARALAGERDASQLVMASLEERVAERTADLQRADREKSRFLANMSHELRTPLNGIIAVSEKLLARQKEGEGRELAELIVDSGRLLERVLGDAIDFTRLDTGEVALVEETLNVPALVERVTQLHKASAQSAGLDLTWSVAPECTGRFRGDGVRIAQVLSNLVGNAVKFTDRGWVDVRVGMGAGGRMRFTVSDTGAGFDADVQARLFQGSGDGEAAVSRRADGTGIGLAICRRLVEAMGGEIDARSRPGLGSAFTFELPLAESAVPARAGDAARPGSPIAAAPIAGARVLLAEDHPTNQKVVSLILGAAGAVLTVVEDGVEALAALEAGGFDLVLMDVQMPRMDGLTAVRRLREREQAAGAPPLPVVMLTANALNEHETESLAAGADRHVSKPIRTDELIAVAAELLTERRPPAARKAA